MPKTALGGLSAKLALIREEKAKPLTQVSAESLETPTQSLLPDHEPLLDSPSDSSMFLLLPSDGAEPTDEDETDADLLEEFQEMLRDDEAEDALDDFDPDVPAEENAEDDGHFDPPSIDLAPVTEDIDPTLIVSAGEDVAESLDKEDLLPLFEAFYKINRSPTDDQFHALADSLGVPYQLLEEALYELIGDAVSDESVSTHEIN